MNIDDTDDKDVTNDYYFMLFMIHVYLIMCLYGLVDKLVATQLLKDDSLKANRS